MSQQSTLTSQLINACASFLENTKTLHTKDLSRPTKISHIPIKRIVSFLEEINMWEWSGNKGNVKTKSIEKEYSLELNILRNFVKEKKPKWSINFKTGMKALKEFKDEDLYSEKKQIFHSLENLNFFNEPYSYEIKKLMKELMNFSFEHFSSEINHDENSRTGFKGEQLSYELEFKETGVEPKEMYLEDNKAGYDLEYEYKGISRYIEVKASKNSFKKAEALISENELSKCKLYSSFEDKYYLFHFWHLSESSNEKYLARMTFQELDDLLNINSEARLPKVGIPYRKISPFFKKIDL